MKYKYLICLGLALMLGAFGPALSSKYLILRVAVIDTGLNMEDPRLTDHLCPTGHKDFTGEGLKDYNGHGTSITSLIEKYAGESNYCLVIVKYYRLGGNKDNSTYDIALKYALSLDVDIINFSGGGSLPDQYEKNLMVSHPGILFVVAAGNENENISIKPYFPAAYDLKNVISVGALDMDGLTKAPFSNYGDKVKAWEIGVNVEVISKAGYIDLSSGTSEATAIHTGKLIQDMSHK